MSTTAPKAGLRFLHSRVLDTQKFDGKSLQLFEVTRVARGTVYYRPVYGDLDSGQWLGKAHCCPVEDFYKWVGLHIAGEKFIGYRSESKNQAIEAEEAQ